MGRTKQVDDARLLELIDEYFLTECAGRASLLTLPKLAAYIAKQYPGYKVTTLRRNPVAREHIDTLCANDESKKLSTLVTYKTLDIPRFLDMHFSRTSLSLALAELDSYYKTIAENAVEFTKRYKEMSDRIDRLTRDVAERDACIAQLKDEIAVSEDHRIKQKEELAEQQKKLQSYKELIETCIYPDIANVLLEQDGELSQVSTTINPEAVDDSVISLSDKLPTSGGSDDDDELPLTGGSNVIQGLFNQFGGVHDS